MNTSAALCTVALACAVLPQPSFAAELPPILASAASASAATAPVSSAAEGAAAIAVARIPAESAAAEATARDVIERFAAAAEDVRFRERASTLAAALTEFERSPALGRLDSLSIGRLETLQRQAELYLARAQALQATANAHAGELSETAGTLATLESAWTATLATPGLPEPLRERARATVDVLVEAEGALELPLGAALTDEASAASLAPRAARAERRVVRALAIADERLLRLDVPPLWRPSSAAGAGERLGLRSLAEDERFLKEYSAATSGRDAVWNAITLALLATLLWLRRRHRQGAAAYAGDVPEAAGLLHRPWSAWLLIALIGIRLLHPHAPGIAVDLVLLLSIVPLIRLAPGWLMGDSRSGVYGVAALLLLDRLRYVAQDGASFRYVLLAVSLCGAAILAWVAWRARTSGALRGGWRTAAALGGGLGAALLAAAAVANVVGNVTLADVLTRGTALGAYRAVLLVVGAAVAFGVVALVLSTPAAQHLRIVANHRERLLRFARRMFAVLAGVFWIVTTLQGFRLWQPVADRARAAMREPISVGDFSVATGDVALFAACVYVSYKLAQFVRFALGEEVLSRGRWPLGVRSTIQTLSFYVLVAVGFLVALQASGVELGRFAIVAGALGVGVGLGLQNVVSNFVSGLILMFERPIQPGDVVDVDGTEGTVKAIGLRATTLGTLAGAEVIVPNGTLLQGKLVNWAREPTRRVELAINVAHGTDPALVLRVLTEVAARQPRSVPTPPPAALLTDVDTAAMRFVVAFSTEAREGWRATRSAALVDAVAALRGAGVDIAPPSDLRITGGAAPAAPTSAAPATTAARTE